MTEKEKIDGFAKEFGELQTKWGIGVRPNISLEAFVIPVDDDKKTDPSAVTTV